MKYLFYKGLAVKSVSVALAALVVTGFIAHNVQAQSVAKTTAPTSLQNQGEQFINSLAQKAIENLVGDNLSQAQQKAHLEELLMQNFDMPRIARFVLGRYWRIATPEQQTEFTDLFQKNIIEAYGNRLSEYSGQEIDVVGSRLSSNQDFILVDSIVKDEAGRNIAVEWRIKNSQPFKIADVSIEGVSMAATQRSQYASLIQRNGGSINAFLDILRKNNAEALVVAPDEV